MDVVRRWLTHLDPERGAALAADLATLPGRDPYARGSGRAPPIQCAEWSLREGSEALRFAWNVDEARTPVTAVFAVLRRWGPLPEAVSALEPALQGVHLQVGLDGARAKLYVYGAGVAMVEAARSGGGGLADAALPSFLAFDLTTSLSIKRYFELDRSAARDRLAVLGAASFAAWADSLPEELGTAPGRFVVSERWGAGGLQDVTLHVKVDRAPERLAELAGPELAGRLAARFREAARMRLTLRPTYVSRLWAVGGGVSEGEGVGTVYYRLAGGG